MAPLCKKKILIMRITFRLTFYTAGQKCGALCNKTPFNVHHLPLNVLHSQLEEWHLVQQNSFLMCTTFHSMFHTVSWKSGAKHLVVCITFHLTFYTSGWKSGTLVQENSFSCALLSARCSSWLEEWCPCATKSISDSQVQSWLWSL